MGAPRHGGSRCDAALKGSRWTRSRKTMGSNAQRVFGNSGAWITTYTSFSTATVQKLSVEASQRWSLSTKPCLHLSGLEH